MSACQAKCVAALFFCLIDKNYQLLYSNYDCIEGTIETQTTKEGRCCTVTLNELPIGKTGRITKVGGEGALRCRLLDMGLIPKTLVKMQKMAPLGDPIEIHLRSYELTLRKEDAEKIEIVLEEAL